MHGCTNVLEFFQAFSVVPREQTDLTPPGNERIQRSRDGTLRAAINTIGLAYQGYAQRSIHGI